MAVSYFATGAPTAPVGSATVAMPAGVLAGDRIFVFQSHCDATGASPANWTPVYKDIQIGTGVVGAGTGHRMVSCHYRDYDGVWTMPAAGWTLTVSDIQFATAVALRKDGSDSWDAPSASPKGEFFGTPGTAFSATTTTTTTNPGAVLIAHTATNDDPGSFTAASITGTNGFVSGTVTTPLDGGTSLGSAIGSHLLTCKPTVGASGTLTLAGTLAVATEGGVVFAQQTVTPGLRGPILIPNRYVGPMALRQAFRRADFWTPDVAVVVNNFSGTADTAVTVGLIAAGVVGVVGSDFTAVTVGLTASGVVGTSSASTSTDVTAGLTASGSVDELHPAPPLIIPNRNVGPMALRQAFRRADWWTSPGFENLNVPSTDTVATVGLTASGVVGTLGDATTAVTVGLTAAGVVGTSSSASTAVTVGLTAAGVVGTSSSASTAVTVGLTADGVVGTSSSSTSTDLTVGLVASGSVDELHPAPPLIIPNRNVGPMALRQAFRRADPWTPDLTVVSNISGTSTSTDVTVGLTASGVVGTSSTASTAVTVGLTAAGVVGTSSTASTAVTVGLTAAGAVGTTSTASTAVTVGLTAAGVVGTTSTASSAVTVAFTADGVVGLVGAAQSTDVTIGLTADGTNPANIAPAAQTPFQIPNRYVGPMALRQAFRRADWWTPVSIVSITSDTTDTAVTVGLTAAGVVGTSSASTTTAVTVTLTAAGVVGTTSTASTSVTVGLTAAGVVGTVGQASTAVTVGLTAAGVVGKASTATTSATVGLTAAGVVGTVSQTTTSVTVGLTAAGVVGIVSQATTSVMVGLTADGFITSDQLASTAFTSVVVALTAAGGIQIFTSPKHTVTARAVALAVSANATTRTSAANASTHGSNADGSTRTGVGDATTRDTSN